jgi:hypothetical protein
MPSQLPSLLQGPRVEHIHLSFPSKLKIPEQSEQSPSQPPSRHTHLATAAAPRLPRGPATPVSASVRAPPSLRHPNTNNTISAISTCQQSHSEVLACLKTTSKAFHISKLLTHIRGEGVEGSAGPPADGTEGITTASRVSTVCAPVSVTLVTDYKYHRSTWTGGQLTFARRFFANDRHTEDTKAA